MVRRFSARDYRRPDDHQERHLYWCSDCQYGRLAGDFTADEIAAFYPAAYYTHGAENKRERARSLIDRLRVHLSWRLDGGVELHPDSVPRASTGKGTFCDLGCGSGTQLSRFKQAGYDVVGVEPDPHARAVAEKVCEVVSGTAENLPSKIAESSFQVVLLSHVLEHCIDPVRAISNVRTILETGGTLVVEVPNNDALGFYKFGAIWPWTDIPRHLHFFTEQSLRAVLRLCGFEVEKVDYVGYTRQFQPEWTDTQEQIWTQIGSGSRPNFRRSAWALLFRSAWASPAKKYDSVRVYASPRKSV